MGETLNILSVNIRPVSNGYIVSYVAAPSAPATLIGTSTEMVFDTMADIVAFLMANSFGPNTVST